MTDKDSVIARTALAFGQRTDLGDCPDPAQLQAWCEQRVAGTAAAALKAHIAHCDRCFELCSGFLALDADEQTDAVSATPRRRWRWLLGAPAMTAGVLTVMIFLGQDPRAPIPLYELTVQGEQVYRGGNDDGALMVQDGAFVSLVMMPATAIGEQLETRAYMEIDGVLQLIDVPIALTDKGVAALEGEIGTDITLPPAAAQLYLVIGRHGELPSSSVLRSALQEAPEHSTDTWSAWRLHLERDRR